MALIDDMIRRNAELTRQRDEARGTADALIRSVHSAFSHDGTVEACEKDVCKHGQKLLAIWRVNQ